MKVKVTQKTQIIYVTTKTKAALTQKWLCTGQLTAREGQWTLVGLSLKVFEETSSGVFVNFCCKLGKRIEL